MGANDHFEDRRTVSWLHLRLLRPYAIVYLLGFVASEFPTWRQALADSNWLALVTAPVLIWIVGGPMMSRAGLSERKNAHLKRYEKQLEFEERAFNSIARIWLGMLSGIMYLWITSSPAASEKYAEWRLAFWNENVDFGRKVVDWTYDLPLVQYFQEDTADRGLFLLLAALLSYLAATNWRRFQEARPAVQVLLPILSCIPLMLFWISVVVYGPATDYDFPIE